MPTNTQVQAKFSELVKKGSIKYNHQHIEVDRKYREISISDVREVLRNGKLSSHGIYGKVEWIGQDIDGREIKLICTMTDADENEIVNVLAAELIFVGTAVQPSLSDDAVRVEWLKHNPEWYVKDPKGQIGKKRK